LNAAEGPRDRDRRIGRMGMRMGGKGGPSLRRRFSGSIPTVIFEKTHGNETWVCASHLKLLFYNDVRNLKPQVRQKKQKTALVLANMVSPPKCVYCRQNKAKYGKIARRRLRYEAVLAIQQVPLQEHNELVSTQSCIIHRSKQSRN
jgi:hypothetical protein